MTDTELQTAVQAGITAAKSDATLAQTWIQKHERILIVLLVLVAGVFLTNHLLNNIAARDQIQAQAITQQLNAQKQADAQLESQAAAAITNYQATVATLTQQNMQLAASVQTRTVVVQQQQKTDATLPLPDLGKRWSTLGGFDASHIVASTTGFNVDPIAALATTQTLEKVPALTQNLADTQTQLNNSNTELSAADTAITSDRAEIVGLQTTITDQDKACKSQLTLANANAKKGKWRSFWTGVGVGAGAVGTAVIVALVH